MCEPRADTPIEVLLVEDTSEDADLMERALKKVGLNLHVTVVEDGEQALCYLWRQGRFTNAPRPELILLDLHLPRRTGLEVLSEVKRDELLRQIPVVIMTKLADERELQGEYDEHVNCCVEKPSDHAEMALTVEKILEFWGRVTRCPATTLEPKRPIRSEEP